MSTLHIKPARPDLVVLDPVSRKALPAGGDHVPETDYWLRRLADGDAVYVGADAAPAAAPAATPADKPAAARKTAAKP